MEMVFEDPPEFDDVRKPGTTSWTVEAVRLLKSNPGKWLRVREYPTRAGASQTVRNIKRGSLIAFDEPIYEVKYVDKSEKHPKFVVYVRTFEGSGC